MAHLCGEPSVPHEARTMHRSTDAMNHLMPCNLLTPLLDTYATVHNVFWEKAYMIAEIDGPSYYDAAA